MKWPVTWRRVFVVLPMLLLPAAEGGMAGEAPVRFFDLAQVRLLDGPFRSAQNRAREYLLAHEVDRLVAPFRVEAGLEPKAPPYGNWEGTGLGGHTGGHYLTALAQMWAATGDSELSHRLDTMVAELAECQRANDNGYVGGVPGGRELWRDVAAGRLRVDNFTLNGKWVPWYNLHKTYAGLRDAWLIGQNAQARAVLLGLSDWCLQLCSQLSDDQLQQMLRAEHGGMNEVLADAYAITGDRQYLHLAERFSHRAILGPLLRREDRLTGLHANTQIPKVIGFARIAELGGDASWGNAARFFWETVTRRRSVAFGGNSVREHFNPVDDCSTQLQSREGPETCNTYNMLRLTEQLYRQEPAALYADYYERALYNHILSTIHPEHGGFVYFTTLRPRHYRVYSQAGQCFWCCVGSGMENHGKYGRFIYAHAGDALLVNLFIASELDWPTRGLRLRQETVFPDAPRTRLTLSLESPQRLVVRLRHPGWVAPGQLRMAVNGQLWPGSASPLSYEALDRVWRDGDSIDVELPMQTSLERLPDGSDYAAVLRGPIVLAARTGTEDLAGLIADDARFAHVAPGRYLPLDAAPMLVGDPRSLADQFEPVAGKPLSFRAPAILQPDAFRSLELIPFFRLHDSRYALYWRMVTPEEYPKVVRRLEAQERERLALEARTLDQVIPGEQQPEVEHNVQGAGSTTGVHLGRPWRDARAWFSYDLKGVRGESLELIVTTFDGERNRRFDILANNQRIAEVRLDGRGFDSFSDQVYVIPADITAGATDGLLTVKFVAHDRSRAGRIYGVRLARPATESASSPPGPGADRDGEESKPPQ
jgi:DUF1680 family protein